jgi:hypothetical protein
MGEVVNLRRARKARDRAGKETTAAANRAAFGRSKAEKARDTEEVARRARLLDGAKRDN